MGPVLQSLRLKILEVAFHWQVIERPCYVVVRAYRFISEQLPQIRQCLYPGQLCRGDITLELEHLKFDLQQIALADVTRFVTCFADIYGVLKTLEILRRQLQSRLGEFNVDKLRGNAKGKSSFVVGNLRPGHGRHVLGRLQAVLPLLAALKQITDSKIKLRRIVQVIAAELTRLEDRQELRVPQQHWIRTQVGRCFFRLVLLNHRSGSQQGVIVLERHLNGLIERNRHSSWILSKRICLRGRGRRRRNFRSESPFGQPAGCDCAGAPSEWPHRAKPSQLLDSEQAYLPAGPGATTAEFEQEKTPQRKTP